MTLGDRIRMRSLPAESGEVPCCKTPCPLMQPTSKNAGFELVAYGLLLGVMGWLLHRNDPTLDFRLLAIALTGGGLCIATGLLTFWRAVNLRWSLGLLLVLAVALGWQAWQSWHDYLAREGSSRPVPVMTSVLCLLTVMLGGVLWRGGERHD